MPIDKSEYEAYAAVIRSGQMEQQDVPKFMEENVEFAEWYKDRFKLPD